MEEPNPSKFPPPPIWATYDMRPYGNLRMARFRTHSTYAFAIRSIKDKGGPTQAHLYRWVGDKWLRMPYQRSNGD